MLIRINLMFRFTCFFFFGGRLLLFIITFNTFNADECMRHFLPRNVKEFSGFSFAYIQHEYCHQYSQPF